MALLAPSTVAVVAVGLMAAFGLLIALVNGQLRRQNDVPLIVAADRSIDYGSERIFSGGDVSSVRIVEQPNYDGPDSFGVAIVRKHCAKVTMPYPYFDHLPPTEAAVLAAELAKALGTVVVGGPIRSGKSTQPSRLPQSISTGA